MRRHIRFEFQFKHDVYYATIEFDYDIICEWESTLKFMHTDTIYRCKVNLVTQTIIILDELKPMFKGYLEHKEYELKKIHMPLGVMQRLGSEKEILRKGKINVGV